MRQACNAPSLQSPRMSRIVLRLPTGNRPGAVPYVRLDTAGSPVEEGEAQPSLLPRAALAIGVWPAEQLTLLATSLPPMPQARLQAALTGALEDRLLGSIEGQHLAAGPRAPDGAVRWAACSERASLAQAMLALEQAGLGLARVVPEPALLEPGQACLQRLDGARARLLWRDAQGEAAWLHLGIDDDCTASPVVSRALVEPGLEDLARKWLGGEVELEACAPANWLARAADCTWDLRQFELAPRAAAQRLWTSLREQASSPAWRRAGWLAATLAGLQVLGLNLQALQLRHQRSELERQVQRVVDQALPGTPAVLDPSLQMSRALDQARQRVGEPTSDGLEVLMGAAAGVLGGMRPRALDFSAGRLELQLPAGRAEAAMPRCAEQGLACSVSGDKLLVQTAS